MTSNINWENIHKTDHDFNLRIHQEVMELKLDERGYYGLPDYSGEIHFAWRVIEKLKSDPQIHMIDLFWDVDSWFCHIHSHCNYPQHIFGEDTAPMVICMAALKAMGFKTES